MGLFTKVCHITRRVVRLHSLELSKMVRKTIGPDGVAVGHRRGHPVTRRSARTRHVRNKGHGSKRTLFIRELIREVSGLAPYEKRILELMKNDLDKRALRLAKKKLGTHKRGKKKRDEMAAIVRTIRQGS